MGLSRVGVLGLATGLVFALSTAPSVATEEGSSSGPTTTSSDPTTTGTGTEGTETGGTGTGGTGGTEGGGTTGGTVTEPEPEPEPPPTNWRPPDGASWRPPSGAVFNHPRGTEAARWRIVRTVDQAIRNAWPGSRIWIVLYLMDSKPTADALLAAHKRGVEVRMVVNKETASSPQVARVARAVNGDNGDPDPVTNQPLRWGPDESFVTYCEGSCRSRGGFAHSKFYLFSHTGAAKDVTMVSSSNLNAGGAVKGWNDLYVIQDDPKLLYEPDNPLTLTAGFATIHDQMAADRPIEGEVYREVTSGPYTAGFFPTTDDRDPVYEDLNQVQCTGATGGAGLNGRTVIRVSMFTWSRARGIKFAHKLVALGKARCDVGIIYAAPGIRVRKILIPAARKGYLKIWNSQRDVNPVDGKAGLRVHHKYLLINGVYGSNTSSWSVHNSSDNWAGDHTWVSDENLLTVRGRGAFSSYVANWNLIRKGWATRVR